MTLQSSGPISISQIQTAFGGQSPTKISEYYRGGLYITANNTSIPTSIPTSNKISFSNFYGATRAYIVTFTVTRDANDDSYFYLSSSGFPTITVAIGGNGSGSVSTYYIPANTNYIISSSSNTRIRLSENTMGLDDRANNNPDSDFNDLTMTPNIGTFYQSGGNFYYVIG